MNNLLFVPIVYSLDITENHFVLALSQVVRHGDFAVGISHRGDIAVHYKGQISHVSFLRIDQFLKDVLALLQERFDFLRVQFDLKIRFKNNLNFGVGGVEELKKYLFVAFVTAESQRGGLVGRTLRRKIFVMLTVDAELRQGF